MENFKGPEKKEERKLKVLMAAAECAPFVKVGGLADVVGSLPKALSKLGVDVRVVVPKYREILNPKSEAPNKSQILNSKFKIDFGGAEEVGVYEARLPDSEVPIYFLENERYLSGGGVYFSKDAVAGSQEEIQRFAFFSKAVVGFLHSSFFLPHSPFDIVHCNDWHTGLIPGLLKTTASVFTIHNLANQGFADLVETRHASSLHKFLDSITQESELIKWDAADDNLDLMLQCITASDLLSTVSPTYAKEILTPEFGEGLQQVLKAREGRLYGILNGIDTQLWDPGTDQKIEFSYSLKEGLSGKIANKIYLQKELGLKVDADAPVIGMVTRLAEQKGFDLILEVFDKILSLGVQLVVLGVGDEAVEGELRMSASGDSSNLKNEELGDEGNFSFTNRFDEGLAHRIYAGADLFLMPSKFEPCGLVQLIAMRYGALPIVRATGGLKDTVEDGQTGFVFEEYSAEALLEAIERAVGRFGVENIQFRQMIARAMRQDFSWDRSAGEYLQLYRRALEYRRSSMSF